jgi:hypothetical protein
VFFGKGGGIGEIEWPDDGSGRIGLERQREKFQRARAVAEFRMDVLQHLKHAIGIGMNL